MEMLKNQVTHTHDDMLGYVGFHICCHHTTSLIDILFIREWLRWQDSWVKNMLSDKTTIIVTAPVKNPSN
jgi:hypothetical protein